MHTPPPTTTDPNPIPAPSQLTVSRHAPTRVRVLNVRSCLLLFDEASPQTALSICTLSARRRHRRRWNLRWARLWRATPRSTLPTPCPPNPKGVLSTVTTPSASGREGAILRTGVDHAPRRTPQELMLGIAAIDDATTEEKAQHHPYHPPLVSPIRIFHPRLRTTPLPSSISCARSRAFPAPPAA